MKADKKETLNKLRTSQNLYLVFSLCSRMPFVYCDPETFDDQVLLYFDKETAEKEIQTLSDAGERVQLIEMKNQMFLPFYTGLFPMGVNALLVDRGTDSEICVQLTELVRRQDEEKLPEGQMRIENPQMHLTALYFVQEFRKKDGGKMTEKLQELNDEMLAHFPVLKQKDGKTYQPVFTDIPEFRKFDKEKKFKASVVEASKIPDIILNGVSGVAVNPLGVNIILNIRKNPARQQKEDTHEETV